MDDFPLATYDGAGGRAISYHARKAHASHVTAIGARRVGAGDAVGRAGGWADSRAVPCHHGIAHASHVAATGARRVGAGDAVGRAGGWWHNWTVRS